jgi:hypothetical protein
VGVKPFLVQGRVRAARANELASLEPARAQFDVAQARARLDRARGRT